MITAKKIIHLEHSFVWCWN